MSFGSLKSINEHKLTIPNDIAFISFDEMNALNMVGMNISGVCHPLRRWEELQ
jgi:DNA-binding LacI/PurR family transcriptional regulator